MSARRRRTTRWLLIAEVVTCAALLALAVGLDAAGPALTPAELFGALTDPEGAPRAAVVAAWTRLPRAALAVLVGAALAIAGALLQALYRNPLADPSVTGVSQGAVAAVVLWVEWGLPIDAPSGGGPGATGWALPGVALVGAIGATAAAWGAARVGDRVEPTRLLLVGVLLGGALSAATSVALLWGSAHAADLVAWLTGSLAAATWDAVRLVALSLVLLTPLLVAAIPRANLMRLGDTPTAALGEPITRARAVILLAACGLTGVGVCTVGGLSFVGLIAPHLVRPLVGGDLRRLVPTAALAGSALVLAADLVARHLALTDLGALLGVPTKAATLPTGVLFALVGAPLFVALLGRRNAIGGSHAR